MSKKNGRTMRLTLVFICIIFIFVTAIFSNAEQIYPLLEQPDIQPTPIIKGEVLVYSAKIGLFPFSAGKQSLEVVENTEVAGHNVYHLKAVAETNGIFSKIYNFRNQDRKSVV